MVSVPVLSSKLHFRLSPQVPEVAISANAKITVCERSVQNSVRSKNNAVNLLFIKFSSKNKKGADKAALMLCYKDSVAHLFFVYMHNWKFIAKETTQLQVVIGSAVQREEQAPPIRCFAAAVSS